MSKFHTHAYSFTAPPPTVPPTLNHLRRPSIVAALTPPPLGVQTLYRHPPPSLPHSASPLEEPPPARPAPTASTQWRPWLAPPVARP
jgi:hypothetical protein